MAGSRPFSLLFVCAWLGVAGAICFTSSMVMLQRSADRRFLFAAALEYGMRPREVSFFCAVAAALALLALAVNLAGCYGLWARASWGRSAAVAALCLNAAITPVFHYALLIVDVLALVTVLLRLRPRPGASGMAP